MDIDIIDPDRHSNTFKGYFALQWRHSECDGVSNHQLHDCLLNRYSRSRSRKTSKLRANGPCERIHRSPGNSPHKGPVTRKNVSIWWRHHGQRYSPWWMFLFNTLSMCAKDNCPSFIFNISLLHTSHILMARHKATYLRNRYTTTAFRCYVHSVLNIYHDRHDEH